MLLHDSLNGDDISNLTINLPKLKEGSTKGYQMAFEEADFDYEDFLETYAHEDCTILAYWLYDNYNIKLGAVRAIDMNDEADDDYSTVVHQFVVLPNHLIIDARGAGTEKDMLDYYREASIFDDEEWDFLVDYDYKPATPKNGKRDFSEYEELFNKFMSLLNDCAEVNVRLKDKVSIELSTEKPNYVLAQLKESGFAFDGMATFYCEGIENVRLASFILFGKTVELDELSQSPIKCRKDISVSLSPGFDSLIVYDKSGSALSWNDISNRDFEVIKLVPSTQGGETPFHLNSTPIVTGLDGDLNRNVNKIDNSVCDDSPKPNNKRR